VSSKVPDPRTNPELLLCTHLEDAVPLTVGQEWSGIGITRHPCPLKGFLLSPVQHGVQQLLIERMNGGDGRHGYRTRSMTFSMRGLPIVCKAYATPPDHHDQHKSLNESHIRGRATHVELMFYHCSANGSSEGNQLAATPSAPFRHPQRRLEQQGYFSIFR
jgi:hypothetical protein